MRTLKCRAISQASVIVSAGEPRVAFERVVVKDRIAQQKESTVNSLPWGNPLSPSPTMSLALHLAEAALLKAANSRAFQIFLVNLTLSAFCSPEGTFSRMFAAVPLTTNPKSLSTETLRMSKGPLVFRGPAQHT